MSFVRDFQGPLAVLVVGACVGGLLVLLGFQLEGGGLAVLSAGPLCWAIDRRQTPSVLFGPLTYLFTMHGLGYAIGPIGQHFLIPDDENFTPTGMAFAQWGALVGLVVFAFSYVWWFGVASWFGARHRNRRVEATLANWSRFAGVLLSFAFVLLLFSYLSHATRRLGEFESASLETRTAAVTFSDVQMLSFVFAAYVAARSNSKIWWTVWAAAFLVISVYNFLEGTRGPSLFAALMSALGFYLAGVPAKRLLLFLAAFLTVFVPIGAVVVNYRSHREFAANYDDGFQARAQSFANAASDFDARVRARETSTFGVFLQSVTANTVDRIMEDTPSRIPFAGLRDTERVVYMWVPKFIYPDRPNLGDGNDVAIEYGVGQDGEHGFTYTPTVGEGYRRFGWFGIALMYLFVSMIYGSVLGYSWVRRRECAWAAMFFVGLIQIPFAWSSTFLEAFHHLVWDFPKYALFILILSGLERFLGRLRIQPLSLHRATGAP